MLTTIHLLRSENNFLCSVATSTVKFYHCFPVIFQHCTENFKLSHVNYEQVNSLLLLTVNCEYEE